MRASWRWLVELSGVDAAPQEMADKLTSAGFEVEDLLAIGGETLGVRVAEVRAAQAHGARWQRVRLWDGTVEHEVICGAANVPAAGGRVLWAPPGAKVLGKAMEAREFGGVLSQGMLCSERELGLGEEAGGICVLGDEDAAPAGTPLEALLPLSDTVLQVAVTPNRPDGLGHVGLAREVALAFGQPFTLPEVEPLAMDTPLEGLQVRIEAPEACWRYGAALLTQVRVGPSPLALRARLQALGMRAIRNVVDVTNELCLLWGHPLHAFDRSKLRGDELVVRLATAGERLQTLDGVERSLPAGSLAIADAAGAVAVAGVMGGSGSEVDDATHTVVIECAGFAPRQVRRTARAMGLATEASHRFERGVDAAAVPRVLADAVRRLQQLTGAVCLAGVDVQGQAPSPVVVPLRISRLESTLGIDIDAGERRATLTALGCRILATDSQAWQVEVPSWRADLRIEADLVEELGRVHGYDKLPERLPRLRPPSQAASGLPRWLEQWRHAAAALGLQEAVHHGFVAAQTLKDCGFAAAVVELENPLSEERNAMRPSLLVGLASAARRAHRHQLASVGLFELGRVFWPATSAESLLPEQPWHLGLWLSGTRPRWLATEEEADFFDAKGLLESLVRTVGGATAALAWRTAPLAAEQRPAWAHPGKAAGLAMLTPHAPPTQVGVLAEVHPAVREALQLERNAVYAELNLQTLWALHQSLPTPQAEALARYPAVMRDLAVVVNEAVGVAELAACMQEAAGGLCEKAELFDLYRGQGVSAGQKSLAFHLRYRDPQQTMTDDRVDKLHAQVVVSVLDRFGATQR